MKKPLVGLILCLLLLPIGIAIIAPVYRVITMFALMSNAKNRVQDYDDARTEIIFLRSRIFNKVEQADQNKELIIRARWRIVGIPNFVGNAGIDYLSYSVATSDSDDEIERWRQAITHTPITEGSRVYPQDGNQDIPPWWPPQTKDITYLGSAGFLSRMSLAPVPLSVWIDHDSSTFYVCYTWGH